MNFATLQGLTIPEGVVTQIADAGGRVLWKLETSKPVILQVQKITSDTYAGETTYTGEQFILLDIYPKTNGTVKVTYGGLTKTVTDTSGAAEPNAQQVFFGTFNGVSDSVATPAIGELTIEGDYASVAQSSYTKDSNKPDGSRCLCVTKIISLGKVVKIYSVSFGGNQETTTTLIIPDTVITIESSPFGVMVLETVVIEGNPTIGELFCSDTLKTIEVLSETPPVLQPTLADETIYMNFGSVTESSFVLEKIIVPKGCAAVYKAADGWGYYANYVDIVEAS